MTPTLTGSYIADYLWNPLSSGNDDEYQFIIRTENPDRNGKKTILAGLDVNDFLRNPQIFLNHQVLDYPIGSATDIKIVNDQMIMTMQFNELTTQATTTKAFVDAGLIRTVSIQWMPTETHTEQDEATGRTIIVTDKGYLIEVSIVFIPADVDAERLAANLKSGAMTIEQFSFLNQNYISDYSAMMASTDTIQVNPAGTQNANSLIESDNIDVTSKWDFQTTDGNKLLGNDPAKPKWDNYSKWFIAIDTTQEDTTKAHYKYPFGKSGKIYRSALIAIRQRAGQQGLDDIFDYAGSLIDKIDKRTQKNSSTINGPSMISEIDYGRMQADLSVAQTAAKKIEAENVDLKKQAAAHDAQVAAMQQKMDEMTASWNDLKSQFDSKTKEAELAAKQAEAATQSVAQLEIDTFLTRLITAGQLLPFDRDVYATALIGLRTSDVAAYEAKRIEMEKREPIMSVMGRSRATDGNAAPTELTLAGITRKDLNDVRQLDKHNQFATFCKAKLAEYNATASVPRTLIEEMELIKGGLA